MHEPPRNHLFKKFTNKLLYGDCHKIVQRPLKIENDCVTSIVPFVHDSLTSISNNISSNISSNFETNVSDLYYMQVSSVLHAYIVSCLVYQF